MEEEADGAGDAAARAGLGTNFWLLWTASTTSNLADGLLKVALPLVTVTVSTSPVVVAGVAVALTLPWLVLALPVGALVDRVDRRTAMVTANVVRALGAGLVTAVALSSGASLVSLYVAAVLIGTAETVHDTAAQAVLPQVVTRDQLSRANGHLHAAELTANEFVGPPLGGLLVALGAALALAVPAATWSVAVGVLLLLRGRFHAAPAPAAGSIRSGVLTDIREGLSHLWRIPVLRRLAVTTGAFNLASNATFTLFVLLAVGPTSELGLTGTGYGALLSCVAAGVLVGAVVAARVERLLGPARAVVVGYCLGLVLFAVLASSSHVGVIAAGFLAGGAGLGVYNVVAMSLRQRITPDHLMGRMTSSYRLLAWGTRPVGAALGGSVGLALGLRAAFVLAGVVALLGVIGPLRTHDREL